MSRSSSQGHGRISAHRGCHPDAWWLRESTCSGDVNVAAVCQIVRPAYSGRSHQAVGEDLRWQDDRRGVGNRQCSRRWLLRGDGRLVLLGNTMYVAGRYNAMGPFLGGEALVAAFSTKDGALRWSTTWSAAASGADYLGLASDGHSLYTAGIQTGSGDVIVLAAYDFSGHRLWTVPWKGSGNGSARSIAVDPVDGALVVGAKLPELAGSGFDIAVGRFGAKDGLPISTCVWGGKGTEAAYDLVVNSDGTTLVGFTSSTGAGREDALVLHLDPRKCVVPSVP